MGSRNFMITEEQRKEYAAGVLLDKMQDEDLSYSVALEGDDRDLEPLFIHMLAKGYVEVDDQNRYSLTVKGLEKTENLRKRYEEYLSHFDIYCAVDTGSGEFAFEQIFELEDEAWDAFLSEERFLDLRIAVAWFKKINPADFVFLSFLKEGRFDTDRPGWQFDLLSGLIWKEIEEVIDRAVTIEELAYQAENGEWITGEMVLEDVISQGAKINANLHAEEDRFHTDDHELRNDFSDNQGTYVTYESYYDPFYISPIWFLF
ncbi:MAG: hypothetical protein RRB13_16580 [bacterium]|nr:hypothetical protein [bacterium]